MKSSIKKIFVLLFIIMFFVGCKPGNKINFKGKYIDLLFNVKYASNYIVIHLEKIE